MDTHHSAWAKLKFRERGCVAPVHVLIPAGVNGDGHREVLGVQVTSSEDGADCLGFFRDLTARGLTGVKLVFAQWVWRSRHRVQHADWHVGSFQGDEVAGVRNLCEVGAGE